MIINLRGTSGSGKSTIVNQVMDLYNPSVRVGLEGRRQPYGYIRRNGDKVLFIPGHYETACGGCDTIKTIGEVFELVRTYAGHGIDVLFEGIMVSGESKRTIALNREFGNVHVIALKVPIEECIRSIEERRAKKDPFFTVVDPTRTIRREQEIARMMEHLRVAKVATEWATREEALARCRTLLGV